MVGGPSAGAGGGLVGVSELAGEEEDDMIEGVGAALPSEGKERMISKIFVLMISTLIDRSTGNLQCNLYS